MTSRFFVQFLLRLAFGMAVAMGVTPPAWVFAAFYRVHLWVLLGLSTLAALALSSARPEAPPPTDGRATAALALSVLLACLSYFGSVLWLYQRQTSGRALIWLIALVGFVAAWCCGPLRPLALVAAADIISSGLLLGATTTAMLLGHWYLNTPGMRLQPLQRLIVMMGAAIALRAVVCGLGWLWGGAPPDASMLAVWASFRWLAGLALPATLAYLAWQTLRIPNTQSATGILYAAVIVAFLGELVSQLLSADQAFPL